jgi:hypothetical protein
MPQANGEPTVKIYAIVVIAAGVKVAMLARRLAPQRTARRR